MGNLEPRPGTGVVSKTGEWSDQSQPLLGHYQLLEEIGRGGGGVVWRARDTRLERDVALKILLHESAFDPDRRMRFFREAKAASNLNHPNIVTIHEIDSADGRDFIVMEYVPGAPLSRLIPTGGVGIDDALHIALQIASALAKAHAAGIVHRDVKPSNIVIDPDRRVKVLDFGLAKWVVETAADSVPNTRQGVILGTVCYMSPEQASGLEVDARSDIFSFGALLFEMLTGRKPFLGNNDLATLDQIRHLSTPSPERFRPDLPLALSQIVKRLLEKAPENRYASIADVARDLNAIARTASIPAPPPPPATVPTASIVQPAPPKRRTAVIAILTTICIAIAALAGFRYLSHSVGPKGDAFELYKQGKQALARYDRVKNRELAIAQFREAAAQDENYPLAYAGLAEATWRQWLESPDPSLLATARENATRAVRLGDHFAAAHAALGAILIDSGDRRQGRAELARALDLDPQCREAHYALARHYALTDQRDLAQQHLDKALALSPNDWANLSLRAFMLHRRGLYNEAIAAYKDALKLAPDNAHIFRDLATVYHMAGSYDDAASALQQSLAIEPSHRAYNNLGTLRFFQGHYAESARLMEKATELGPTRFITWGNLGDAYRWTPGEETKAADAYQVALRLVRQWIDTHSEDAAAKSSLAVYLAKTGEPVRALATLESLPEPARRRSDILYKTAVVSELAGRRADALRFLADCLKIGYSLKEIEADPELQNLRRDARYQLLLNKLSEVK